MFKARYPERIQEQIDANKSYAVGYKRVSDISQVSGASLDTQTKEITKYCQENKLTLLKIYSDEGISGLSVAGRGGFLQLIEEIKPGNFIIVYELSRFSRDIADIINYFRDLVRNKGCTFISLNPRIDSRDSCAELMIGIYASVTQEESNRTSERVKSNMRRLSEEGKLLCRPPFGYVHEPSRRYVPNEEQQAVVEKIRLMNLCGVKSTEIAKRLNNEGLGRVLNNNKKKKISDPTFSCRTIQIILQNYGFVKNEHSPKYTYPQRVEAWNMSINSKSHKATINSMSEKSESESQPKTDNTLTSENNSISEK
jgi:DNA invertase Pin-like site-specific DNA recombinase